MSKRDKCIDGVELLKKEQKNNQRGPKGPVGPTGPCCNVPDFSDALAMGVTLKEEAATFYGVGEGLVGIGDVFDFPLDGANDPIGRLDSGTFVLPHTGLYKVSWQMPIVQGPTGPTGPAGFVQATLTAQTVDEGAFVPVAGGVVGRDAALAQLVGEVFVEATYDGFPIRLENTSTIPVNYYAGNPANPNQRTINIASLVPRRLDAVGTLLNVSAQLVPANADVNFDTVAEFLNVEFIPTFAFEIQITGRYLIDWHVKGTAPSGDPIFFAPFRNGVAMPLLPLGASGPFESNEHAGTYLSADVLNPGDIITLRNVTAPTGFFVGTQPVQLPPPPSPAPPPPPDTTNINAPFYNALFRIRLTEV